MPVVTGLAVLEPTHLAILAIAALTIAAILTRPFRAPEWLSATVAAALLIGTGLLGWRPALKAVAAGTNVYLFLAGMLLLSEIARTTGVFRWLASAALRRSNGSARRLFTLIYAIGVLVTALLSNDATVLLLTPAVLAVVVEAAIDPLPYLYACAFVSGAASFALPISNPANLVVFANGLPLLLPWLRAFALPSLLAVLLTYASLAAIMRSRLQGGMRPASSFALPRVGRLAFGAVLISAAILVVAASLGANVGITAAVAGMCSLVVVLIADRHAAPKVMRNAQWSIVPLVAGMFVVVAAVAQTGLLGSGSFFFSRLGAWPVQSGNLAAGGIVSIADNLFNNLPAALMTRYAVQSPHVPAHIVHAALIGIDLGPNLSLVGSLATLIWIVALRRAGIVVSAWEFSKVGAIALLPALAAALLTVR